jgi:hypothetical protein
MDSCLIEAVRVPEKVIRYEPVKHRSSGLQTKVVKQIMVHRTLAVILLVFIGAHSGWGHTTKESHHSVDKAIWAAISYCIDLRGAPTDFCIMPAAGSSDASLVRRFRLIGAREVRSSWMESASRPKDFSYLEVDDFSWVTPRRARVKVYMAAPFSTDPGHLTESNDTLYVDQVGRKWIIDGRNSLIQTSG